MKGIYKGWPSNAIQAVTLIGGRGFIMKNYGVVYDVGLRFSPDALSVEPFEPSLVEYDINTIAHDLHANAIRVEGEEIGCLVTSAHIVDVMFIVDFKTIFFYIIHFKIFE